MRTVRGGPLLALTAGLALIAALALTVGLSPVGWLVGIGCAAVTAAVLSGALDRHGVDRLGSANCVTLTRAVLAGGVAALTADSFVQPISEPTLVALTAVALLLDAVDGWVARRTGTTSELGARFDMEVDAFLILVLSVAVAPSAGGWVLLIGAARYAFVAAGWFLPWMRSPLKPRSWRKVVAATQGIVLAVAVADILPRWLTDLALAGSMALLAESFGRDIGWLWRHRSDQPGELMVGHNAARHEEAAHPQVARRGAIRTALAAVTTVLAGLLVWFALVAPNDISGLTPQAFIRIPIEGLLVVGLVLALPVPASGRLAALVGVVLGLLTLVKIIDMGFFQALDRPFDPLSDWTYLGPAVGVLSDSIGRTGAIVSVVAVAVLAVAVVIVMPLCVLRLTRVVASHRATSMRAVAVFGVVWIFCAVFGVQIVQGAPVASASAADLAYDQVRQVSDGVQDQQAFAGSTSDDPFSEIPGDRLLTGLRGKNVIIAFVESYGRVAVQDSAFSPQVDAVLDAGSNRLRAAGFSSRSAFLTSPTFGGISWLAHSTLQSGLWVDNQQRYDQLVASNRLTLSDAFKRAGWRTVGDVPSNERDWPEGTSFYHYDKIYDERNVGYLGPKFSYAAMPDQYILSAFQRLELAPANHSPVMAELDLVSSHTPWTPLPQLVDWARVGDGSIFNGVPEQGQSPDVVWQDAARVRAAYGESIQYSLTTLVSFVQTYGDDNLVMVVVGDHQPATIVSGQHASHDVPISIIARDPAVLDRISHWGWQDGLRPGPQATLWPMDTFRDRFLAAYGP